MTKLIICGIILLSLLTPVTTSSAPVDGYLIIPKIKLYKSVVLIEDSDSSRASYFYDLSDLNYKVGRLQYTSWGNVIDNGRTVLVGHTPGAFERLHELETGDTFILSMENVYYTFTIFDKYKVHYTNDSVLSTPAYQFEVVFITCTDDPDMRLIIKAK